MKPCYILINLALAFALFLLNVLLGTFKYDVSRKYGSINSILAYGKFTFSADPSSSLSGNYFQKIVNPTIFLAVAAAILQNFATKEFLSSMWLLLPLYWGLRCVYMVFWNSFSFTNKKYEFFAFVLSLALGESVFFLIISPLLNSDEKIWIPVPALRDALWFAVIAFIFKTAWDILSRSLTKGNLYPEEKRQKYVRKKYEKFRRKYDGCIQQQIKDSEIDLLPKKTQDRIVCVLYSIMIFEDFNRPFFIRKLEVLLKRTFWKNREMSLGIMQVRSYKRISDFESIKLAMGIISKPFYSDEPNPIYAAVELYNSDDDDYVSEVITILEMIPKDGLDLWDF